MLQYDWLILDSGQLECLEFLAYSKFILKILIRLATYPELKAKLKFNLRSSAFYDFGFKFLDEFSK